MGEQKDMSIKWRTRKRGTERQIGQRFPIIERATLPREDLRVVSMPENVMPTPKEKLKEALRKTKEKIEQFQEEQQAEESFTEEEIIEAGKKEIEEELGLSPEDYEIIDGDEIKIRTFKRVPIEPEKKEDTEVDWVEHKRREAEFKRTKGLSSVR